MGRAFGDEQLLLALHAPVEFPRVPSARIDESEVGFEEGAELRHGLAHQVRLVIHADVRPAGNEVQMLVLAGGAVADPPRARTGSAGSGTGPPDGRRRRRWSRNPPPRVWRRREAVCSFTPPAGWVQTMAAYFPSSENPSGKWMSAAISRVLFLKPTLFMVVVSVGLPGG